MSKYFGTDGIRGRFGKELTIELAYFVGNSLGSLGKKLKILVGKDTRISGDAIELAFSTGVIVSGASVTSVGICPTAGIAYLTSKFKFDYGVVISASHNPAEYNGIKIFDKLGKKISSELENEIESKLGALKIETLENLGTFTCDEQLTENYITFLDKLFDFSLISKTIALDMANGASSFIAKRLFENKGAKVIAVSNLPNGLNINENSGATHIENLIKTVKKSNADYGFSYDGDSDRVIAVDENGKIFDGDRILYIISNFYKLTNKNFKPMVVGTILTNMGLEQALFEKGIGLERTDVGDKNICKMIEEKSLLLGGEQSGHIIVRDLLPTGDGILNSLLLSFILEYTGKTFSELCSYKEFNQVCKNVRVKDKNKILDNEKLKRYVSNFEKGLENIGRLVVRASGTEPVIRIMVEAKDDEVSNNVAEKLLDIINEINEEI